MSTRRKKALDGKYLLIISSIVLLNVMGVSYASWTEQWQIVTSLRTGNTDPVFCDKDYRIKVVRDGHGKDADQDSGTLSDLRVEFQDDNHTLLVSGQLEEGYKAFIGYCLYNKGTIPVKYDQAKSDKESNGESDGELKIQEGLKVKVNQSSEVLEPGERLSSDHGNGSPKIQIQVQNKNKDNEGKKAEEEDSDVRSFELKLPFKQWTNSKPI